MRTKMNEEELKLINKHIKYRIVEQMTLNSSELSTSYELSTYEKMNYELKNV